MPFPDQNFHTLGIVQITSISMFTSPQTLGIYDSVEFQWGECQTDDRGWIGYEECTRTSLAALLKSVYDGPLYGGLDGTHAGSFRSRRASSHIPPVYGKVVCMKLAWDTLFIGVVVARHLRWLLRSWESILFGKILRHVCLWLFLSEEASFGFCVFMRTSLG